VSHKPCQSAAHQDLVRMCLGACGSSSSDMSGKSDEGVGKGCMRCDVAFACPQVCLEGRTSSGMQRSRLHLVSLCWL
jgi:hypothetical protein